MRKCSICKSGCVKILILFFVFVLAAPTLGSSLDANEEEQEDIKETIEEYEADIETLAAEIRDLEDALDEEYAAMSLRIKAFYENYSTSLYSLVFCERLGDGLRDMTLSIKLLKYDRTQLEEISQLTEELNARQEEVLALLDEAYADLEALEAEHDELEAEAEAEAAAEAAEAEKIKTSTSDLKLLASIIYCEAGGEIYEGKVAVACVVMNRVDSSKYPNTISGVIYQSGQFTPASSGRLATVIKNNLATDSCYQAAQYVLAGNRPYSFTSFRAASVSVSHSYTQIGNQKFW